MKLAGLSNNAVRRIQGSIKQGFKTSPEEAADQLQQSKKAQEDGTGGQDYWKNVKSIAEDIKDDWMRDPSLDVNERVWEEVDGHHYIIYYHANMVVLQNSDNDDAISDAGVDIDTSKGWRHILTQVAFYAMERDVYDALEELGFDGEGFEMEEDEDWDEE